MEEAAKDELSIPHLRPKRGSQTYVVGILAKEERHYSREAVSNVSPREVDGGHLLQASIVIQAFEGLCVEFDIEDEVVFTGGSLGESRRACNKGARAQEWLSIFHSQL